MSSEQAKKAPVPRAQDNLRESLQRRLMDAESRMKRSQVVVDWQKRLIDDMAKRNHSDIGFAREVLAMLYDSLNWNEAQVKQIKSELDFLNRRSN